MKNSTYTAANEIFTFNLPKDKGKNDNRLYFDECDVSTKPINKIRNLVIYQLIRRGEKHMSKYHKSLEFHKVRFPGFGNFFFILEMLNEDNGKAADLHLCRTKFDI